MNRYTSPNDMVHPMTSGMLEKKERGHITNAGSPNYFGITLRQHYAGLAMQGLLVNYQNNGQYGKHTDLPMVSEVAVRCADQLIAELNKEETEDDE